MKLAERIIELAEMSQSIELENYVNSHKKELKGMKSYQFISKFKKLFGTLTMAQIEHQFNRIQDAGLV